MSALSFLPEKLPSREVCADAAAWLTILSDPDRTLEVEEGFRLWLAADPDHGIAFQMAMETWDRSAQLRRRPGERFTHLHRVGFQVSWPRAAMVIASVAASAVLATVYYLRTDTVSTAIGEQRSLTLEDGTRVALNTDTRIAIDYDPRARHVELKNGEALFEVAKDARRPFSVVAGERTITALGTSFVVRRDALRLSVTLVDGKVSVAASPEETASGSGAVILHPGERLTLGDRRPLKVDRPALEKVTAWQHGQVAFDHTPLVSAIAEMNRYSAVKLIVETPEAEHVQISGVFRAGDSASFARAMAETYQLRWSGEADRIVLSGAPVMPREE